MKPPNDLSLYMFQHIQYLFIVLMVLIGALLTNFLLVSNLPTGKRLAVQAVAVLATSLLMSYVYEHFTIDFKLLLLASLGAGGGGEQLTYWLFYSVWWKNKDMDESISALAGIASKIGKIISIIRGTDNNTPTNPPGAASPDSQ